MPSPTPARKPSRIERELMRGIGPAAVLKLLSRRDMYGYELVEALANDTKGILEMGQSTLYPLLYNLEAKDLIEGYWKEGGGDAGARDRKYYRITGKGKKRLEADSDQLSSLVSIIKSLGIAAAPIAVFAHVEANA